MTDAQHHHDVPTRVIDGHRCTTRAGIAALAGWPPGATAKVRANQDADFPTPIRETRIDRQYWYPFDGDQGVNAYLELLAQRAQAKKPPALAPGDPNELLRPDEAAAALGIEESTFRSYVRYSLPYWQGTKTGRPLLPPPDDPGDTDSPKPRRRWRRATLAAHQAQRPGPGTGAGRPAGRDSDRSQR